MTNSCTISAQSCYVLVVTCKFWGEPWHAGCLCTQIHDEKVTHGVHSGLVHVTLTASVQAPLVTVVPHISNTIQAVPKCICILTQFLFWLVCCFLFLFFFLTVCCYYPIIQGPFLETDFSPAVGGKTLSVDRCKRWAGPTQPGTGGRKQAVVLT